MNDKLKTLCLWCAAGAMAAVACAAIFEAGRNTGQAESMIDRQLQPPQNKEQPPEVQADGELQALQDATASGKLANTKGW